MELRARIEALWEEGRVDEGPIIETIEMLDRGELRVAEPGPDGWTVNEPGWLGSTAFDEARTGSQKLHFAAAVPWTSTRAERSRPNKPA